MKRAANHDEYLERCEPFAAPILARIRKAMHQACPEIEETMKWNAPHFEHHGLIAGVAAFKRHVRLIFWRGKELTAPAGSFARVGRTGMGALRLEQLSDLPPQRVLVKYAKQAAKLNESAARAPQRGTGRTAARRAQRPISAPRDLAAALRKNARARCTFDDFSATHRREYVEWIEAAKRDTTRASRIEQAVAWMAEGKSRNWKYRRVRKKQ